VRRYEELRHWVTEGGGGGAPGLGLATLLHRGLPTWLDLVEVPATSPREDPHEVAPSHEVGAPGSLATCVAQMALARRRCIA